MSIKKILFWTPRVLSILVIALFSMLAFDVFAEGYNWWETIIGLFMHLIPSFFLIATLVLAWKKPLWGGIIFLGLAVFAAFFFKTEVLWERLLIVPLPIALLGGLFLASHWVKK